MKFIVVWFLGFILAIPLSLAKPLPKKLYFSAQVDERSAEIVVKVGNRTCTYTSDSIPFVSHEGDRLAYDDGFAERLATCEFDLLPGAYEYDVQIKRADGRRHGFVSYWAFDSKPINNKEIITTCLASREEHPILNFKIYQSGFDLLKKKSIRARGTVNIF